MFKELSPFRSTFLFTSALSEAVSQRSEPRSASVAIETEQTSSSATLAIVPNRLRRAGAWLGGAALVVAIALITAAPWLDSQLVWCGWLGAAAALWLSARAGEWGLLSAWTWTLLAICVAFHWAPVTLSYTMESSYSLGLLVALLLAVWESFRAMLPFWLAGKMTQDLGRVWLAAGLLTVAVETLTPSALPWKFGYTQIDWLWTVQAVDLFGSEWSSLMYFAHAGAILTLCVAAREGLIAWRNSAPTVRPLFRRLGRSPVIWLCAANLAYGAWATTYWRRAATDGPTVRVALVQVDPRYNDSTQKMRNLANEVADRVDLVCWPESSGGSYDLALDRLSDERNVFALSRDPNRGLRPWANPQTPLLLGAKTYSGHRERPKQLYQTAILLDKSERIVGRYHKRDLMPFGEYVPGEGWLPGANWLFPIQHPVARGLESTVLSLADEKAELPADGAKSPRPLDKAKLGVMLCYEDMLPETSRSLVNHSANVLISLINGSAFSSRLTLEQHRRLAQLRAVECRRYFLRCAATGETCAISPIGEIEDRLPLVDPGVLIAEAHLLEGKTWFSRLGQFFPVACGLALAIWVGPNLLSRLRSWRFNQHDAPNIAQL